MLLDEKVRHHRARLLIIIAWVSGATIGLLPMFDVFGFASDNRHKWKGQCEFTVVSFFVPKFGPIWSKTNVT
jgi:hypothetical protein